MLSGAGDFFSPDYYTARLRFREAAERLGWELEAHPLGGLGPQGQSLTVDVASSSSASADATLVISSGMHGVEGFFGSAVQLALLDHWSRQPPSVRCVLLHALNPYGFAWQRRFDEHNIDPNRNFLLETEQYSGVPALYAQFDHLLNPQYPPRRWDPFRLQALGVIARHGVPALRQAVACGQYEYPRGVFYGGAGPSSMHRLLANNLRRWLAESRDVAHLDLHTGLGPMGSCKLLIDYEPTEQQRRRLIEWFGADAYETHKMTTIAYDSRGSLGRWCQAQDFATNYLFACAEFGTYGPVQVLSAIRSENQSYHWGQADSPITRRTKQWLQELFCPAADPWRQRVVERSLDLVQRAMRGLTSLRPNVRR